MYIYVVCISGTTIRTHSAQSSLYIKPNTLPPYIFIRLYILNFQCPQCASAHMHSRAFETRKTKMNIRARARALIDIYYLHVIRD